MIDIFLNLITSVLLFYPYWSLAILLGAAFLSLFLSSKSKFFGKFFVKLASFLIIILLAVLIFINLLNPLFFGYGYVEQTKQIYLADNILVGIDYLIFGGNDGGLGTESYRIHGINLDNGTKIYRRLVGEKFQFQGLNKGIIWVMQDKNLIGYNLITANPQIIINAQILEQKFPIFSQGIANFELNQEDFTLLVKTKDGFEYFLQPLTMTIVDKSPSPVQVVSTYPDLQDFALNNQIRKQLTRFDQIINQNLFFIEGEIINIDSFSQKLIVKSYETTDKKDFILSVLSFEGKLLWQLRRNNLIPKDFFYQGNEDLTQAVFYANNLILAIGGTIVSVNAEDGKIYWQTRL